ncbi:MAG: hypothetical protein LBP59_17005 [Planctomycetaceae bacterium]|jgi:putative hydrolase of the HAD superfamily|nr:hypothetical protein [Planctomycetaceae bacterium]
MPVRFIFFDLGNVLFRFSSELMLGRVAGVVGCLVGDVYRLIYEDGWEYKLETGKATEQEFFDAIYAKFGCNFDRTKLADAFNDIFTEIIETRSFLEYLSSISFPCGILSNTSLSHWNHIVSKYPYLIKLIPCNYAFSFECGSMKPERVIFEYAMNIAQKAVGGEKKLEACEILFIDDLAKNIEGAINFGFDAIQFTNWKHVEIELKKRRFLSLDFAEFQARTI